MNGSKEFKLEFESRKEMNEQQAASMMNQQQQQPLIGMSQGQMVNMNARQQMQPPMMNRKFGAWSQGMDQSQMQFKPNAMNHQGFVPGKQQKPLGVRNTWKGKKGVKNDNRMDGGRRLENPMMVTGSGGSRVGSGALNGGPVGASSAQGGYKPPTLNELQWQNRIKARKFFHKKKTHSYNTYNNNNDNNSGNNMEAPFAPRNTTSFLIRAKKSGGIASLVSPCPVTPAVLPTPVLSPSSEVLVDMAKEVWGVDGYGSMKGLIRLRSPGQEIYNEDEQGEGGSSESDVEEHVEVERRLDHDLSRFEMIYPNCSSMEYNNILENRVDDQDSHIAQLEEENLILKERLFLMEREVGDLRRRLQRIEMKNAGNESENDSESHGDTNSTEDNNLEVAVESIEEDEGKEGKSDSIDEDDKIEENDVSNTEEAKDCVEKKNDEDILVKEDEDNEKQQIQVAETVKDEVENVHILETSEADDGINASKE